MPKQSMGADNVAYDDEPGDCGGGSVTVTASPPPDVMPIFVSLPSLLSDTQQPAPTAPPTAVTEAAKHPKSGTCSSTTWLPQGGGIAYGVSGDAGVGLAGVTSTGSAGFGVFMMGIPEHQLERLPHTGVPPMRVPMSLARQNKRHNRLAFWHMQVQA